jgi:protease-4
MARRTVWRGASRAAGNLSRAARLGARRLFLPRAPVLVRLRLTSPVHEQPRPSWWQRDHALPLLDALRVLSCAARDPEVAGVVVRSEGPPGGLGTALSLQRAIAAVRAAGKPVVAWSESYDASDLLAVCAASRVLLPESGSVGLVGLRYEGLFLRDALERLGLAVDVVRVGAFKSAGETFTRDSLSPEHREQLTALVDDQFRVLVDTIAAARGLEPASLRALVDEGPFTAAAAQAAGLVDEACYPDELEARLPEWVPALAGREPLPLVDAAVYAQWRARDAGWLPLSHDLPHLAYVVAEGAVLRGRGARGVRSESYRRLLRTLEEDERVAAVVVRIDSPGGEVVASDLLWRALRRLGAKKPVVASLGDIAASGGYYLACGAQHVVAEAATLTGSIGVVGGKLDASSLLTRLGVGVDGVGRGARAGLHSPARGFDPGERRAVRAGMEDAYQRFVARVAESRGLETARVHALAQGRLWSGAAAQANGLVDALGGPLEAIAAARERAGIAPDAFVRVDEWPRLPRLPSVRDLVRP